MEEALQAAWWTKTDFHGVRQVAPGRWLYTCQNAGALWPIGHCSVHCRHSTREDAEWHCREYLLDTARFGGRWAGKEYRCEVCDTWTDRFAILKSYTVHSLCAAHLNRDGLDAVLDRP
jgi:hypothetical protein